jgi:site-specific DNA-cytosine methylase
MTKILVACEESQAVTTQFRLLGMEAWSCDILPCSGGYPEWHIQTDIKDVLNFQKWDAIIAFPPCTHLAVSGARHFPEKRLDGRQQEGINFFMQFVRNSCSLIAIENPVGIMSTTYRKPDQIIQPWMFGHMEQKATCLWLKGLPKLIPTNNVKELMLALPKAQRERIHYLPPTADRAKLRSKTYEGIAKAMAEQWSVVIRGIIL